MDSALKKDSDCLIYFQAEAFQNFQWVPNVTSCLKILLCQNITKIFLDHFLKLCLAHVFQTFLYTYLDQEFP